MAHNKIERKTKGKENTKFVVTKRMAYNICIQTKMYIMHALMHCVNILLWKVER